MAPVFNFDNHHTKFPGFFFRRERPARASKAIGVAASQILRPFFSHFNRVSFGTLFRRDFSLSIDVVVSPLLRPSVFREDDKIGHN